jgi:hypothetical protein
VFLKLCRGEVRTPQVLAFVRHLLRHIPGKVIVLWDGLGAHWSKMVREWAAGQQRLKLVRLPAYVPVKARMVGATPGSAKQSHVFVAGKPAEVRRGTWVRRDQHRAALG